MSTKPWRIYSEQWNPSEKQINSVFPIEEITSEIGRDPGLEVLRDDEVRLKYPDLYNISVQARAHNRGLIELLQEYYETNSKSPELANLLGVQLPQIMWADTLGLEDKIITLLISKLNKEEVFINDIVLVKNEDFDPLSDELLDKVLNNLRRFAKEQGAKYLSGYATNRNTLELLMSKGFKEDERTNMGNDYLCGIARSTGEQFPFYDIL
ncbi:MAG TPA: hypothetical protein VFC58_08690 [Desulfosporosinus sp.]|nr:hypothetical protein [Desulfosporosinus sp.]